MSTRTPTRSGRMRRAVGWLRLVAMETVRWLHRTHSPESAATLAYHGFLALIPSLLLVVYVIGRWLTASEATLQAVERALELLLPTSAEIVVGELRALSRQRTWPAVSVAAWLASLLPLAARLRRVMARIFAPEQTLPLWRAKLHDVAGALTLVALLLVIIGGRVLQQTAFATTLARVSLRWTAAILTFGLGVLLMAAFWSVFVPVRLTRVQRWSAALMAAALLFLLRPAFGAFLRHNPNYGVAFGSLKALFVVAVWIYLCFLTLLFTANLISVIHRRHALLLRAFLEGASPDRVRGLESLAGRFERRFRAGERIFDEGEGGRSMYYIVDGEVRLERGGRPLTTLGAGDFFGEMALLIDTPRTARAVAARDAHLLEISRENAELILREHPRVALAILRELAGRLRATDERLIPPTSVPPPDPSVPR